MKKITASEAETVVGGICKTCVVKYQNVTIGGVTACNMLTTCTDKYGTTTHMKGADANNCGGTLN